MLYKTGRHFLIGTLSILVFLLPQTIFAADSPNLISPVDNSTENKSPKLIWEYTGGCVESGSCFRVEVDNTQDFSSPEKSTYTNNYSYSPQDLTEGVWSWRVKAKDKTEKWSDWSKVFKFRIQTESTTSPEPSSSLTPTTQPSPTTITIQKSENSFNIKDIPNEINSNQEFESSVTLILPNNPNQTFYLKGAFKKDGSSNYFGQTYSGEWAGNSEKYSKQLKITTSSSGSWEGKIKVKPDTDDSGFNGSGSYIFKVARYTDSGSGPTWSNELSLRINAVNTPKQSPSAQPEEEISEEEDKKIDITASLLNSPEKNYQIQIASVAGESTIGNNTTSGLETKVLAEKNVNWFLVTLGIGVLAAGGGFVVYKLRKERTDAKIYN